jgi:hypothetical protein
VDRDLESQDASSPESYDMIRAVESRSDLDRRIIGQVVDLESTKHGVETREMRDRDKIWTVGSMEISTVDQTQ